VARTSPPPTRRPTAARNAAAKRRTPNPKSAPDPKAANQHPPCLPPPRERLPCPKAALAPAPWSSPADVPLTWNAGDVILDLYEVKGELGKGGMGVVYRVHHRQWNIDLAVKTPLPEALQKAGSLENFLREAQAWVDLGLHPHIVTCYYVRRLGEMPRVFAECMEGGSLKNWMEDGRLYAGGEQDALKRILDCAIQFAWGLGYAHEKGLVHQDVKPANALMTPDGMLKVTDFGLVGAKGYTPAYAAPEQELGQAISPRTDIWGWGVSVLEMFTGGVHWQFGSVAASVLENYLHEAPPEGIPPMPAALAELLRQCFQNDPEMRPASMDEVAERLIRLYKQETGVPYPRQKPKALELRADSLNNKAVSLLDLGQEEEAVRCWQEALEADPAHLEANFNYGYYRWHKADISSSEFIQMLFNIQSHHSSRYEYWNYLSWIYVEQGNLDAIVQIISKVSDLHVNELLSRGEIPIIRKAKSLSSPAGSYEGVQVLALSPDEKLILTVTGLRTARILDADTGMTLKQIQTDQEISDAATFSPCGKFIFLGLRNGTILCWDIQTELKRVAEFHKDWVGFLAFIDEEKLVSASWDGSICIWNVRTLRPEKVLLGHTDRITALAFSKTYVLSAAADGSVCLWNIDSGQEFMKFQTEEVIHLLAYDEKREEVILGGGNKITILDAKTLEKKRVFSLYLINQIEAGVLHPNGRFLLAIGHTVSWLWDIQRGKEIVKLPIKRQAIFYRDGKHILTIDGIRSTPVLWEFVYSDEWNLFHPYPVLSKVQKFQTIIEQQKEREDRISVALSLIKNGQVKDAYSLLQRLRDVHHNGMYERDAEILDLIAQCGVKGIRKSPKGLWCVWKAFLPLGDVRAAVFLPSRKGILVGGGEIIGGDEFGLHLVDLRTSQIVKILHGHTRYVNSIRMLRGGEYILTSSFDGTVRLWNIENGLVNVWQFESYPTSIAVSADDRFLVSGHRNGAIHLWALDSENELRKVHNLDGHHGEVSFIEFSANTRYCVSGSWDKTVRIWDVQTGQELLRHYDDDLVLCQS
jgi:WD40 repeat protein